MVTKYKVFTGFLLVVFLHTVSSESQRNVPYMDPVYRFLEKSYSRGWLAYLPQVHPYTEMEVLGYLVRIDEYLKEHRKYNTPRIRKELDGYIERFKGKKFHVLKTSDKLEARGRLDFGFSAEVNGAFNRMGDTVPLISQSFVGGLEIGKYAFLGLDNKIILAYLPYTVPPYRKFYEPQRPDDNLHTFNLTTGGEVSHTDIYHTPGEKDLSVLVNQKSQANLGLKLASIQVGRDSLWWGPSPIANLALSQTAKPYDYISFDLPIGKIGRFSWMTGFLKDYVGLGNVDTGKKLITAHRAEIQFFKWFLFGLYEAVVYSHRFELGYLNPFGLYYVNEVRLGDYDNKLGGIDLIFRLPP
ncbi:MAG: hypothetical protein AB1798_02215, partial [Spirochaetota bacterium]